MRSLLASVVCAASALALSSCSITAIKEGMNDLKGQPLSAAIAKLGFPNEESTIAGQKVYIWRSSSMTEGTVSQCHIRVIMAGDVIGSYDGSGDVGTCSLYAGKLRG